MFETKIIQADIPSGRRVFVTSDLHGHGHYLRKLLERVHFSHNDFLIIAGDILEKGPDSLGTLRYVMSLCRQENVYVLMGNVDAFSVNLILKLSDENAEDFYAHITHWKNWWHSTLYHEMAAELGYSISGTADVLRCKDAILQHFAKELAFITQLPTILDTQSYIFVHGGLREKEPAANVDQSMFALTKYDNFANTTPHIFDKYVVVGHWPVTLYRKSIPGYAPVFDTEKHIISIDGGCGIKEDGQLNLLCIPDIDQGVDAITWECYDELPVVTALEDQSSSENSISINWQTRQITILERGEEFTRIRHHHTGEELLIPTAFLYSDTECRDYTNYHLPVKKGDRLSVAHKTSKGIIAKHRSVIGWYTGEYECAHNNHKQ